MSLNNFCRFKEGVLIKNIKKDPADTSLKEDLSIETAFGPS
jgi:hypothetical protein